MTVALIILHAILCVLLIMVILMQSGRGGGLTEAFSSAESMFGAKTNQVMVKATTILSVLFITTSLTLAYFSAQRGKSLMERVAVQEKKDAVQTPAAPTTVADDQTTVDAKTTDAAAEPAGPETSNP